MSLVSALSGYKTYLAAGATVLATVAAVATGSLPPFDGVVALGLSLAQIFIRSGSKADAARAAVLTSATLVEQLAPAVAKLMPGSAAALAVVEKAAADVAGALSAAPASVVAVAVPVAAPAVEPVAAPVPPAAPAPTPWPA